MFYWKSKSRIWHYNPKSAFFPYSDTIVLSILDANRKFKNNISFGQNSGQKIEDACIEISM